MSNTFGLRIDRRVKQTEKYITAVHRRSVEKMGEAMTHTKPNGGKVPFQDGDLARSLLASTEGMPTTSEGPFDGSNIGLVTATLNPDQPVWLGYQAVYARRLNSGFVGKDKLERVYNQAGEYFVEAAVANWSKYVQESVDELNATLK